MSILTQFRRPRPWERAAYCPVAVRQLDRPRDRRFTLTLTVLREPDELGQILTGGPRIDGVEVTRFAPPADRDGFRTETAARDYAGGAFRGSPDHPLVRLP